MAKPLNIPTRPTLGVTQALAPPAHKPPSAKRLAVLLVLGSVDPTRRGVHGEAVHHRLDLEIFELPEGFRVVLPIHTDGEIQFTAVPKATDLQNTNASPFSGGAVCPSAVKLPTSVRKRIPDKMLHGALDRR